MPASHSSRLLLLELGNSGKSEITQALAREDCYLVSGDSTDGALELARNEDFDTVICDYRPDDESSRSFLAELRRSRPHLPLILVSENPDSEIAIEAIKAGAYDLIARPVDPEELRKIVTEAVAASRRMSTAVEIGDAVQPGDSGDAIIGRSRAMLEVYKSLGRLSATPVTVLIRGETGTGKELVARAIYQHGHRAHQPFITVNCAAIPENLLESELFGHEKGSFTGAIGTRVGKFEQAHNATLFLDEIGDLDLSLQSKLLRVLQERQIQRVGGQADIPVDVRIIAATHRDLDGMVATGDFREDLYYRLNVATIALPPLRARPEDIEQLVEFFLQRFGRELNIVRPAITTRAVRYLDGQPWPGNVRQLQNVTRKALLKCRGFAIDAPDLQEIVRESEQSSAVAPGAGLSELALETLRRAQDGEIEAAYPEMVAMMERSLFEEALRLSGGNQAQASRWLGLSRPTLRQKLHKHGLRPGGK